LFAVLMATVTVAGSLGENHPSPQFDKPAAGQHITAAPTLAYLLVGASALVLIWRRRRPVLTLAVSLTGSAQADARP
jgi:hypothetical protein